MSIEEVAVPDIGDFTDVPVIEIHVGPGDEVAVEDPLVTLESDKATMDVPAPVAGVVKQLRVKLGDRVSEGSVLLVMETQGGAEQTGPQPAGEQTGPQPAGEQTGPQPAGEQTGPQPAGEQTGPQPAGEQTGPQPAGEQTGPQPAGERETRQPSPGGAEASPPASGQPPQEAECDVLVLGAGPGGYTAAFRAADLGLRVILVERHARLGGVCLNVGCIPSKTLLHAARAIAEAEEMATHGVAFGKPKVDLDALREWKDSVVARLTGGLEGLAKRRKVEVVHGDARFRDAYRVDVGGRTISFAHCIVAAGSSAVRLPFLPDDPRVMASTGALALEDVPKRLLVVGGGIIGLEMATVYNALGSRVTVVELMDGLIPGCDRDLVKPLQKRISERYEAIHTGVEVTAAKAQKNGIKVTFSSGDSSVYDRVLVAVGRRPNGGGLGADAAGVQVDERGFIAVDRQMRTNVPHIFAVGDIVGGPMLAHKASHEAKVAAEVIAGDSAVEFDARTIPSVAYTDPEVAWMGLTETEARERGIEVEKAAFPWAASGRALSLGREDGLTKLLIDPASRRVLGAGIVGVNAGELVAETVHALEMGADVEDLALTVHPHPTLSETVGFAAEYLAGTITDVMPPGRLGRR